MLSLGRREIAVLKTEAKRLIVSLRRPRDSTKKSAVAALLRSVERFSSALQSGLDRFQTTTLWQVVMLVTCVEAYLQDLLCIASSVDAELMNKSEQLAPYAEVIASTSLEELASELRGRWARGRLSDGGRSRWITRLERMGARGYPDDLAPRLELIWGIRHVVVHAAGVATRDFVKRHPGVVAAVGDRVRISTQTFGSFLDSVQGFVNPTEQFFLVRYPSLAATAPTEPPNDASCARSFLSSGELTLDRDGVEREIVGGASEED